MNCYLEVLTMEDQLLSDIEAAPVIGLKTATLRNRRLQGKPPKYLKVGRKCLYRLRDLQEYLRECERHPREGHE